MSEVESLLSQLSERESHFVLNAAIGKQQIDSLKSAIGQNIPPQLLEVLSCFDGEKLSFSGMIGGERLLSSQEIIDSFKTHIHIYGDNEDDEGFMSQCPYIQHGVRWRTGWIPIAAGEEETVYLDTCPAVVPPGGTYMVHGNESLSADTHGYSLSPLRGWIMRFSPNGKTYCSHGHERHEPVD